MSCNGCKYKHTQDSTLGDVLFCIQCKRAYRKDTLEYKVFKDMYEPIKNKNFVRKNMVTKLEDRLKVFLDMVVDMRKTNRSTESCHFEIGISKTEFEIRCILRSLGCKSLFDKYKYEGVSFYLDKDEDGFIEIMVENELQ